MSIWVSCVSLDAIIFSEAIQGSFSSTVKFHPLLTLMYQHVYSPHCCPYILYGMMRRICETIRTFATCRFRRTIHVMVGPVRFKAGVNVNWSEIGRSKEGTEMEKKCFDTPPDS